jgi:kinesin family member 3B
MSASGSECVRVVVRIRPLSSKEVADGRKAIVKANSARKEIIISNPNDEAEGPRTFTFDQTYGDDSTQKEVYETTAGPIVESVLNGFNGTIFACESSASRKLLELRMLRH